MKTITEQPTNWIIVHGEASWHQRRAGHFYAASIVINDIRAVAENWREKYLERNPGQPCYIRKASNA